MRSLSRAAQRWRRSPSKPGDRTTDGVRYYRPEPYLLVTREQSAAGAGNQRDAGIRRAPPPGGRPAPAPAPAAAEPQTSMRIIWLPNRSEEYVIRVRPGIGTASLNVSLTDGWNLTGTNADLDSKTSEFITAISGLAATAGRLAALGFDQGRPQTPPTIQPGLYRLEFGPTGHIERAVPVDLRALFAAQ